MITDKLIYSVSQDFKVYGNGIDLYDFARAIYKLGQEHEAEECAKLIERTDLKALLAYDCASAGFVANILSKFADTIRTRTK